MKKSSAAALDFFIYNAAPGYSGIVRTCPIRRLDGVGI